MVKAPLNEEAGPSVKVAVSFPPKEILCAVPPAWVKRARVRLPHPEAPNPPIEMVRVAANVEVPPPAPIEINPVAL